MKSVCSEFVCTLRSVYLYNMISGLKNKKKKKIKQFQIELNHKSRLKIMHKHEYIYQRDYLPTFK